jgi:dihydrofolate reductase
MGRKTFEPALSADRWPWPNLDVFVLGTNVPTDGAPVPTATDSDPARLRKKLRATNRGGDVHLVGGPQTTDTFRELGALGKLGLLVLPIVLGDGMRLTLALDTDTTLTLDDVRALQGAPSRSPTPAAERRWYGTENQSCDARRDRPAASARLL